LSTTPLIVGGDFTLNSVDFSDAVLKVTLNADADDVAIPATMSTPKTSRRGGVKYSLQIDYLANDTSDVTEMFRALWDSISSTTGTGELPFTLQLRPGSPTANNPQWGGTVVTLTAHVGGTVEGLSTDSITLPLTGAPTITY
jgi:hypothetical protein